MAQLQIRPQGVPGGQSYLYERKS